MPSTSVIVRVAILTVSFALGSCTAILVPDEDDDGVARCDLTTDCPELDDNRYVAVCVQPEDLDPNADKICSADYETVHCGATAYSAYHPLTLAHQQALADSSRYGPCPSELLGARGCGPKQDGCEPGLVLNPYGTCDDPKAEVLSVGAGQLELDDVVGRDVADQFCRAYFCDERFVCSHRTNKPRCVPCDPNRFFGRAGCGTLYIQGQPSSVYLDVEQTGNCDGDMPSAEIPIGPL
ncbi:MAG TPA: hypothetical protein VK034_25900 [Enhygromyxa sp.]|nr:hypothetical protein [Enhygromyxa sp.]